MNYIIQYMHVSAFVLHYLSNNTHRDIDTNTHTQSHTDTSAHAHIHKHTHAHTHVHNHVRVALYHCLTNIIEARKRF